DRRNAWSWNASGPGTAGAPCSGSVGGPDCEDGVASYADVSTDDHYPEGLRQKWRAGHGGQVDLSYPLHSRHRDARHYLSRGVANRVLCVDGDVEIAGAIRAG